MPNAIARSSHIRIFGGIDTGGLIFAGGVFIVINELASFTEAFVDVVAGAVEAHFQVTVRPIAAAPVVAVPYKKHVNLGMYNACRDCICLYHI